MHHDSEKSQRIRSFVTPLGLLKKKKADERNAWAAISRTSSDSDEVKHCGRPCTARLIDGLNCLILQHNKGIR